MRTNFVSEDLLQKHENEWLAISKPVSKIEIVVKKREFFPTKIDHNFENTVRDLAHTLSANRN